MTRFNSEMRKTPQEMKQVIFEYQKTRDEELWEVIETQYDNIVHKFINTYKHLPYYKDLLNTAKMALLEAVLIYDKPELNPMTLIYGYVFGRVQKFKYKETGYTYYSKTRPILVRDKIVGSKKLAKSERVQNDLSVIDLYKWDSQDHSGIVLNELRGHLDATEWLIVTELLKGYHTHLIAKKLGIKKGAVDCYKSNLKKKISSILG